MRAFALVCLLILIRTAVAEEDLREVSDREADEQRVAKVHFAHRGQKLIKN